MKWFLIASICLLCSIVPVGATPADDLFNKGIAAMQAEKYDDAAAFFVQLVTGYPSGAHVDDARISGGYAYLKGKKYTDAVTFLAPLATNMTAEKASYRATALYFTALSQFSMGQNETDKDKAKSDFDTAIATYTTLIDLCTKAPTPDNKGYLEQSIYYRALAQYLKSDYPAAEKDLMLVIQQFPQSLSKPDYWLRLGSAYASEMNDAVSAKKTPEEILAQAQKAVDAFDQVSKDPNALVQANDADMSKGEILFTIAQIADTPEGIMAGYQKALEAFRGVRRKQDMIEIQQKRLDDLKKQVGDQLIAGGAGAAAFSNQASLLIGREQSRLDELKDAKTTDPIVLALIRMAECYVNMKQPNEARTILHRLAKVQLGPDQQQEVDFQTLYSYVLGGQADQADAALTAYLAKHGNDPTADSISFQIAGKLQERKDLEGALRQADRSLKDFPKGRYVDDVLSLKASILTAMGKTAESDQIVADFLKANPTSPRANNMLITRGQSKMKSSPPDLDGAEADFKTVIDNTAASIDLRAAANASYISALSQQKKFDDVISNAKSFEDTYKTSDSGSKALPSVKLLAALALAEKKDPGAVAALQDVAKTYSTSEVAPFALFSVITVYQKSNDVAGMIQAANDLRKAFPTAYPMLIQAADVVSAISVKAKKFDDAVALYQPLTEVDKKDIAAAAWGKIGSIWVDAAASMGAYSSLPPARPAGDPLARPGADRAEADRRRSLAEKAFVKVLTDYPEQTTPVAEAIEGLVVIAKQKRSAAQLKDADLEKYLTDTTAGTSPEIQARVELAKAGLVFVPKYTIIKPADALDRFKKVIAANPTLALNRQESDQFGQLQLAAGDFDGATKTYTDLLNNAPANDPTAKGYAYYGLGAVLLAQGKVLEAKDQFVLLTKLPQEGMWHPHISDAHYGIALADEQSSKTEDFVEAKTYYSALMQERSVELKAKALLGFGRLLEKAGFGVKPAPTGPTEFAVHYYLQPSLFYATGAPAQSAEGLFFAGQAYEKAGDKANAKVQYDAILKTYATLAPDWAKKAQDAESKLGQ